MSGMPQPVRRCVNPEVWGLTHPWDPEDPDRPCFSCGHPPTARFTDGSPKYLTHYWDHRNKPVYLPEGWRPVQGVRLVHTLSERDRHRAEECAKRIMRDSLGKRRDTFGLRAHDPERALASNILGAAGELAFARLTGLPWHCQAGHGFGKPDLGRYEVRTRSRGKEGLPNHPGDRHPLVLMVKEATWTFRLKGWVENPAKAREPEWYWQSDYRVEPGWLVPYAALQDPRTLPELAP